jgi:hypothetical protein
MGNIHLSDRKENKGLVHLQCTSFFMISSSAFMYICLIFVYQVAACDQGNSQFVSVSYCICRSRLFAFYSNISCHNIFHYICIGGM